MTALLHVSAARTPTRRRSASFDCEPTTKRGESAPTRSSTGWVRVWNGLCNSSSSNSNSNSNSTRRWIKGAPIRQPPAALPCLLPHHASQTKTRASIDHLCRPPDYLLQTHGKPSRILTSHRLTIYPLILTPCHLIMHLRPIVDHLPQPIWALMVLQAFSVQATHTYGPRHRHRPQRRLRRIDIIAHRRRPHSPSDHSPTPISLLRHFRLHQRITLTSTTRQQSLPPSRPLTSLPSIASQPVHLLQRSTTRAILLRTVLHPFVISSRVRVGPPPSSMLPNNPAAMQENLVGHRRWLVRSRTPRRMRDLATASGATTQG